MSKELTALEALEIIKNEFLRDKEMGIIHISELALYCNIKKSLKALEIIQRKMPILYYVLRSENYEFYMKHFGTYTEENTAYELTEEEFDLLREVLL